MNDVNHIQYNDEVASNQISVEVKKGRWTYSGVLQSFMQEHLLLLIFFDLTSSHRALANWQDHLCKKIALISSDFR